MVCFTSLMGVGFEVYPGDPPKADVIVPSPAYCTDRRAPRRSLELPIRAFPRFP